MMSDILEYEFLYPIAIYKDFIYISCMHHCSHSKVMYTLVALEAWSKHPTHVHLNTKLASNQTVIPRLQLSQFSGACHLVL